MEASNVVEQLGISACTSSSLHGEGRGVACVFRDIAQAKKRVVVIKGIDMFNNPTISVFPR
jgi:hypothetical protein